MDLIRKWGDTEPWIPPARDGHYGGKAWDIFTKNTVNPEAMRMLVQEYPPGGHTRNHPIHLDHEQAYYILAGTMTVKLGDEEHKAPAGCFVFIPRGLEHNYRNEGPEDLRFISINAPVLSGEIAPLREQR